MKRLLGVLFIVLLSVSVSGQDLDTVQDYRIVRHNAPNFNAYTLTYPVFAGTFSETAVTSITAVTLSGISSATVVYDDATTDDLIVTEAWIQPSVNIRYTLSGQDTPTTVSGLVLAAGVKIAIEGNTVRWFSCVASTGSGTLRVQYLGWPEDYGE